MSERNSDSSSHPADLPTTGRDAEPLSPLENFEVTTDRIDELTSLLVDEAISDAEFGELAGMLEQDADARQRYVETVQLHCDLLDHFQDEPTRRPQSPVLGFLGAADQFATGVDSVVKPGESSAGEAVE